MIKSSIAVYRNAYIGLSDATWWLALVMFVNRAGTMVLPFLTVYLREDMHYSIAAAGWEVALFGIGALLGNFIGGRLTDKIGFSPVQFWSLFLNGVLFIVLGQMRTFWQIGSCMFIIGVVGEAFRPANAAAVANYSRPENRTRSYSLNRLAINLGFSIGSVSWRGYANSKRFILAVRQDRRRTDQRNRRMGFFRRPLVIRNISIGLVLLLAPSAMSGQSSEPNILSIPAGPFAIGRITYHWIDSSRAEFLVTDAKSRRELMVDVWYPAWRQRDRLAAAYLPDLRRLQRVLGDSALRRDFAPASSAIAAGLLRTHATEAPSSNCPARGCPLLIFSHGGGVDRSFYTSQYEDLASNGYIVAAIAHTYDTHLVVFPNGRVVRAVPGFRDTLRSDSALPRWRRSNLDRT